MWLIVGLGNPGPKYLFNRHNIGFMALDQYISGAASPNARDEHKALTVRFKMNGTEVMFAKPQTFMNLSGESVQSLMDFYKIPLENLIVVHDELDQPFGAIKIQKNRGHGGHNGIKSISEKLGTQDYLRLRLGVGRPSNPKMDIAAYVLANFAKEEQELLVDFLNIAGDALEALIFEGIGPASTKFNRQVIGQSTGKSTGKSTGQAAGKSITQSPAASGATPGVAHNLNNAAEKPTETSPDKRSPK